MLDFDQRDIQGYFEEYIDENTSKVLEFKTKYPSEKTLRISFEDMDRMLPEFAEFLLHKPQFCLNVANETLQRRTELDDVEVTIVDLPVDAEIGPSKIRNEHIGRLLKVSGIAKKVSDIRPLTTVAAFKCSRCPSTVYEQQSGLIFHEPMECYEDQGGCGRTIGKTRFVFQPNDSTYLDYQKIEIQESPENMSGRTASALMCYLTKDLVGRINAGDRVILNGILEVEQLKEKVSSGLHTLVLKVISFEHNQQDYDNIEITDEDAVLIDTLSQDPNVFNILTSAIAPSIKGYDEIKESLLLQLFGGSTKEHENSKLRGNIHILLVGDPGVAKSTLLEYIRQLAPRAVFASGKGASAAGLTAAAVKDTLDKDRWVLEAGALVLADNGICIIDELDKMTPQDRSSIHLAMEQQFINVTKATINIDIPTRCCILGALNPKYSTFEDTEPIVDQINLEPTLLSRFDLIHVMRDLSNDKLDGEIADKMLDNHYQGQLNKTRTIVPTGITKEFVRKYIAVARKVEPILTPETMKILKENYREIRGKGRAHKTTAITPRQLDAMIRLSEASARVRLSTTISEEDAKRAVCMIANYLNKMSVDGDINVIMSGVTGKQKDKIKILKTLIHEAEWGKISVDKLRLAAFAKGIDDSETDKLLDKMRENGEIITPKYGWVSLV